ncbi:MAG: phenylalanine--tRNA ligase subunit alpha [Planctomycetes bacterium]|nr:phenylalanine--tRNA ligase subunit alpha [Planctomycetota bacterium]
MTTLSPNEAALLRAIEPGQTLELGELAAASGLREAQAQSAAESLTAHGYFSREEQVTSRLLLSPEGLEQATHGVAELLIRKNVQDAGGRAPIKVAQTVSVLDKAAVGSAFGGLKKAGLLVAERGEVSIKDDPAWAVHEGREALLRAVAAAGEAGLPLEQVPAAQQADLEERLGGKRKKGLFLQEDTRLRSYTLSASGAARRAELGEARPQAARLTADMLKDGSWREVEFRALNVANPPLTPCGRRNPYRAYLDLVKRKLLSLGFEEMTGSVVEPEYWNTDALFLPQFHPAREIHDVYFVRDAASGGDCFAEEIEGGVEPVASEHEGHGASGSRGWNYDFDRQRTKRLVLRSQGTVLSARWLRKLKLPGKHFAMARCFRYDEVDATHAPDFFQVEGIVCSETTSFRHLLGLLRLFAQEVARADEVKFVPAYFPFTEPSVEVHMKHPRLGWIELGGAGIFRPEVTHPHGITAPVIAWGLGLDRMAMVALGIDDIRHLFTNNLPDGLASLRRASAAR